MSAILCPSNRNLSVLAGTPCKKQSHQERCLMVMLRSTRSLQGCKTEGVSALLSETGQRCRILRPCGKVPVRARFPLCSYLSLAVRLLQLLQVCCHFHLEVDFTAVLWVQKAGDNEGQSTSIVTGGQMDKLPSNLSTDTFVSSY